MQISVSTGRPNRCQGSWRGGRCYTPSDQWLEVGIGHCSAGCHSAPLDTFLQVASLHGCPQSPGYLSARWIPFCTSCFHSALLDAFLHLWMPLCTAGCSSCIAALPPATSGMATSTVLLLLSFLGVACGCPVISYGWESKTYSSYLL